MSKRQWMLGVGIGILVGASLLQVGSSSQMRESSRSESVPSSPAPLNEQQVQQWLKKNGYVFIKQSEWEAQAAKVKELENRPAEPSTTTIYIKPGLSVTGMESLLVEYGLLPKDNRLAEMIVEQGLSRKIRSGMYTFVGKQTEESIIEEITKPR